MFRGPVLLLQIHLVWETLQVSLSKTMYSKLNLSSGGHLDCWCEKWFPQNVHPSFIITPMRADEIYSGHLFAHLCVRFAFGGSGLALPLWLEQGAVLPGSQAFGTLCPAESSITAGPEAQNCFFWLESHFSNNRQPIWCETSLHSETQVRPWYGVCLGHWAGAESVDHGTGTSGLEAQSKGGLSESRGCQGSPPCSSHLTCLQIVASCW